MSDAHDSDDPLNTAANLMSDLTSIPDEMSPLDLKQSIKSKSANRGRSQTRSWVVLVKE
jgi:hypothetical protein